MLINSSKRLERVDGYKARNLRSMRDEHFKCLFSFNWITLHTATKREWKLQYIIFFHCEDKTPPPNHWSQSSFCIFTYCIYCNNLLFPLLTVRNIVINLLITHSPLAPDTTDIEAQASRRKNTVQLAIVIIHTVFRIMMIKTFHGYSFNKLRSRETKKHPQITFQTNTTFTKSGIVRHFLLLSILWNVSILEPIFLSVHWHFVRLT